MTSVERAGKEINAGRCAIVIRIEGAGKKKHRYRNPDQGGRFSPEGEANSISREGEGVTSLEKWTFEGERSNFEHYGSPMRESSGKQGTRSPEGTKKR